MTTQSCISNTYISDKDAAEEELAFYPRKRDRSISFHRTTTKSTRIKSRHHNSREEYDQYYKSPHHINPLQILFFLIDLTFFTRLAAVFTFAWDTITYAWVSTLIQPDLDEHQEQYRYNSCHDHYLNIGWRNTRRGGRSSTTTSRRIHEGQCQFKPVQNVFAPYCFRQKNISKNIEEAQNAKKTVLAKNVPQDDSDACSWGQFVDVDSSNNRSPGRSIRRSFLS